jgi:hypothetical protein
MLPLYIICASCHRSWVLSVDYSVHLELELESHPCPQCEAYTLSCPGRTVPLSDRRYRAGQQVSLLVPRPVSPWPRES